jgi:hypothetical protein
VDNRGICAGGQVGGWVAEAVRHWYRIPLVLHMVIEGAQLGVLDGTFGTYNGLVWDVSSIFTVSGKLDRPMMELLGSPGVSIGSPSS